MSEVDATPREFSSDVLFNSSTQPGPRAPVGRAALTVIVFVSPWVFGFTGVTALAWTLWTIDILVVLAVGSLLAMQNRRAMA